MCGVYNIPDAAASTFELTFMLLMLSTPSCKWFYDAHEMCRMLVHGNAAEKVDAILSVSDSVFNSNATCQRLLPNATRYYQSVTVSSTAMPHASACCPMQ
jgi:hypothetical protein